MPYIKDELRHELRASNQAQNAGQLNYLFTRAILNYIDAHELSYQIINDIMGAFEGAKAEFYRRVVIPYEDAKIKENGDVYT